MCRNGEIKGPPKQGFLGSCCPFKHITVKQVQKKNTILLKRLKNDDEKKTHFNPPKKGRNSTTPKKEETANSPPKKRRNTTTPKKGKNHQQTPKNLGRKTLNFLDAKIIGAPQQPGPPDGLRLLPRSQAYRHPSPSRDERCLWATKRRNDETTLGDPSLKLTTVCPWK